MNNEEALLRQKPVVEKYLARTTALLSSFSFTNIFAWKDFFQFDFKILKKCLCVFATNEVGSFMYLPPLGRDVPLSVIDECFRIMEGLNGSGGVTRIESVTAGQVGLFPSEQYACDKRGSEYCYHREDISGLKGGAYKAKRSSYNHFIKHYRHGYVPYSDGMLQECLALYEDWARQRKEAHSDDIYRHMLDENRIVHASVLRYARELGLIGRVVKVDGKIKAYTFGYALNPETFCVLFEVADLNVKGLSTFIFREFCRDAAVRPYSFINAMDDFEMDNVRQVKMSFVPCALPPVYVVTKRRTGK